MKAQDFAIRWITEDNNLQPFDSERIDSLKISDQSKEFLKIGLPSDAAPFLSFSNSDDANLQPVNEVWDLPVEFENYKIIGSNGYGDPICINENDHSVVYLNHDDEFGYVYMNSSVEQLAHFLLIIRNFIDKVNSCRQAELTSILKETLSEMIEIDKTAMAEGSWEDELQSFIE